MDNQKQELLQKLRDANNILVTVSSNPSVDQLAACIGLTLLLNKLKKHATAVFSGQVPSTLQFLKPDDTLEKNTDSLRDFIVSLDKAKADKLRYKVENDVVKIFITPYKTSITEADLDFSQGDFNIDVVICLGVDKQTDLDQAITSHGRILHDATVISVSNGAASELGTLNWVDPNASSLSELTAQIADAIGREELDGQIATAFLTGIVAETDRFRNEKTSPTTMQLSAQLMSAGANQQLVANELDGASTALAIDRPVAATDEAKAGSDGTLEIGHTPDDTEELPPVESDEPPKPSDDDQGSGGTTPASDTTADTPSDTPTEQPPAGPSEEAPTSRMILQPPSMGMGGELSDTTTAETFDANVDPLSLLNRDTPMLSRPAAPTADAPSPVAATDTQSGTEAPGSVNEPVEPGDTVVPEDTTTDEQPSVELPDVPAVPVAAAPTEELPAFEPLPSEPTPTDTVPAPEAPAEPTPTDTVPAPEAPAEPTPVVDSGEKSLADLEVAVDSPHLAAVQTEDDSPAAPTESLDAARDAVMDAMSSGPQNALPQPTQAIGSEGYLNVQDLPDAAEDLVAAPAPQELAIPAADPTPPTSVAEPASTAPPVPPPLPLDPTQFTTPK